MKPLCVLTIAGSDSGAGAGVQADARTIHALGGYALTAITAITAQNTRGIAQWERVAPRLLASQIEAVLEDFRVAAIKTGLLPGAGALRVVAEVLGKFPRIPLVVDPVLGSTSGTRFLSERALRVLKRELLPRAALVTPNWPEAEALAGERVRSLAEAERVARKLMKTSGTAVLVKGGHAKNGGCADCLATADGRVQWFEGSRIATRNTHGTGCVLSAAIAVGLAKGRPVERAVREARQFLRRALRAGANVRLGRGAGPAFMGGALNHRFSQMGTDWE